MLQPVEPAVPDPCRDLEISDADWLQAFYPWLNHHPSWWIELRFVEDRADGVRNPPVAVKFLRDAATTAAHLRKHRALAAQRAESIRQGGSGPWPAGLFWGVQPRVTQRSGRDRVAAFVALTVRLDCDHWAEWPAKQRPRVLWEVLHRCPQPPSVISWTGNGFDAWWLLREPLFDRRRGEEVEKAIACCLHADATLNAASLSRWPNTVNYQGLPAGQPRPVRVVWWQPQSRFPFDRLLECFLPYAPPPAAKSHQSPAAAWKRFSQLLHDDDEVCKLWNQDVRTFSAQDQNTYNQILASLFACHDIGWPDFEVIAPMAPWNAVRAVRAAELLKVWKDVRGDEGSGRKSADVSLPAAPTPSTSPPSPAPTVLPGLLLSTLPETAWTEWARLYRSAVGASTEAADEFHYLALLTVLGTALGRSVVLHCGRPVYMNVYAVLAGPTGDRKSTAAQLALDLLPRVAPHALLLNGVGSQEGLMERMACAQPSGASHTLWYVDEMASLLKKARRESSGGLIEFVTEIFHGPDFMMHSTRSKAVHLQSPTLSILAGSTPTWLEAALQQEDILGGFANRFVFVTGQPKPDNAMPTRPDQNALADLVAWIQRAARTPDREVRWSPSGRDLWCDFYVEWRRSTAGCSEEVSALLRRIDHYILKFAAMAAAMDQVSEISDAHLSAAVQLGRYLAGCAWRLLAELGAPSDCRLETLIEQKLREAHGQMTRKQLRQAIGGRVSGEKLDRVLTGMERNGLVRQVNEAGPRGLSRRVLLT
jgi:hypothetical protein